MTKFLPALLVFAAVSCGQPTAKQEALNRQAKTTPGYKKLEDPAYSVQYPPHWELNKSGEMQTSFILLSPLESDKDQFRENVNLMIQSLAGQNIDLDKYAELSVNQVKTMVTNCKVVENGKEKNDKQEYYKIIYTGDQGIYHLNYEQYYWIDNGKAYVLTSTCEQDKFSNYKQTSENILNSFALK